jgi:hypothetical protein
MKRDVLDGGDILERYLEPADDNIATIFKMIKSQKCIVRFDGEKYYSDYTLTHADKLGMSKMILVYRFLGGNFDKP